MTRDCAARICEQARLLYGERVEARVDSSRSHEDTGHRAVLLHKQIGRTISLNRVGDWTGIKDAWSAALERS